MYSIKRHMATVLSRANLSFSQEKRPPKQFILSWIVQGSSSFICFCGLSVLMISPHVVIRPGVELVVRLADQFTDRQALGTLALA